MAKKVLVILAHAFVGWLLCGMIMGVGRNITSIENTLIIHAIGAPVIFVNIINHLLQEVQLHLPNTYCNYICRFYNTNGSFGYYPLGRKIL